MHEITMFTCNICIIGPIHEEIVSIVTINVVSRFGESQGNHSKNYIIDYVHDDISYVMYDGVVYLDE